MSYCPGAGNEEIPPGHNVLEHWLVFVCTDWDKFFRNIATNVVYIARYGAQSINELDEWPVSKLRRTMEILSEAITGEKESASVRPNSGSW